MNTKSGPYDSYWIRIRGNESSACLPVHAPKEEPDSRLLNQKSKRSAKQFNHKFIDQCYVNFLICYTTRSFMGNGIYTVKGFMGLLAPNEYKTGPFFFCCRYAPFKGYVSICIHIDIFATMIFFYI